MKKSDFLFIAMNRQSATIYKTMGWWNVAIIPIGRVRGVWILFVEFAITHTLWSFYTKPFRFIDLVVGV